MGARVYGYIRQHHVGLLALFVAMGGVSYAAVNLPTNSVGPKEIKKNAVKAPEIAKNAVRKAEVRANAVRTQEVANASLLEQDFAPGQLPAGEQGPQGEQGVPGVPGEDATKLFAYIQDPGPSTNAAIEYGSGVTSVSEPASTDGDYTVGFNRDLTNCVVQASSGVGDPQSGTGGVQNTSVPLIRLDAGGATEATLTWKRSDNDVDFGVAVDTSFMITAFC